MKKISFLILLFFGIACSTNVGYSFSIKTGPSTGIAGYQNAGSFLNLSFKEFANLSGKKQNLWNRFSFHLMRSKVKHDLKKNPDLTMNEYILRPRKRMSTVAWILYGILAFLLILLIVLGVALRK